MGRTRDRSFDLAAGRDDAWPEPWGHDRVWLSEKDREIAREMRMNAAREGLRAPVQVMEGNYTPMSGTCAWWDGVRGN